MSEQSAARSTIYCEKDAPESRMLISDLLYIRGKKEGDKLGEKALSGERAGTLVGIVGAHMISIMLLPNIGCYHTREFGKKCPLSELQAS